MKKLLAILAVVTAGILIFNPPPASAGDVLSVTADAIECDDTQVTINVNNTTDGFVAALVEFTVGGNSNAVLTNFPPGTSSFPLNLPEGGADVQLNIYVEGVTEFSGTFNSFPCEQPDDDGDGVPNDQDLCPGTETGTEVDEDGCEVIVVPPDSDGDGVPDADDACPGTSSGVAVGDDGCPVEGEQVCSGDKVDVGGSQESVTVTAPEGYLISGYCVKAGSANQGDGPESVVVDPPQASVTITHSSGKNVSHYSLVLVQVSTTTTVPPTTAPPTTAPPTTQPPATTAPPTTAPPTTQPPTTTAAPKATNTTAPKKVVVPKTDGSSSDTARNFGVALLAAVGALYMGGFIRRRLKA